MTMDSVWGSGDHDYFVNKDKHAKHPAYAAKLRASVSDAELSSLSNLAKKYPGLNRFLLESATIGTQTATKLTGKGPYNNKPWKRAAESSLRNQIKELAPHATKDQLISMNKILFTTLDHVHNVKKP